jgi:hypothetical protein
MLPALVAAAALQAGPGELAYRLHLYDRPGSKIVLRASPVPGVIEAFCTSKICSRSHVELTVPASGVAVFDFHVYKIDATAPLHPHIEVTSSDGARVVVSS